MVDVPVSHMTLLIVTIVFTIVNLCLIIATGGIIYNWQDRFMGPVLKCEQPKWYADGRKLPNKVAVPWNTWNTNAWATGYNTNYNNQPVVNTGYVQPNVPTNVAANLPTDAWSQWAVNAYQNVAGYVNNQPTGTYNTQGTTYNNVNNYYDYNAQLPSQLWQVGFGFGGNTWSSWKDGAWSTCPLLRYTKWANWNQPTTTWTNWYNTNTNTNTNYNYGPSVPSGNFVGYMAPVQGGDVNWSQWYANTNAAAAAWTAAAMGGVRP